MSDLPHEPFIPDQGVPLSDVLATEIDRRKIQALIDDGTISPEELANAPIVEYGPNARQWHNGPLDPTKIRSITCQTDECGRVFKTLEQFERHVALDHMGLSEAG